MAGLAGMGWWCWHALPFGTALSSVWGRPEPATFERPRVSLARALAPWLLAASAGLFGWYLVDRRGVELGVADCKWKSPGAGR